MSENQTTELVTAQPSAPRSAAMEVANRLGVKMSTMMDTVKAQCFRGGANVSESQLAAFISVCWEIGANPLIPGQIYAYPTQGGGIIPMVGPDFVLTKLGTHPEIESWETIVYPEDSATPTHATCRIWRKGRKKPLTYTAWLSEWKVATNPNWSHRTRHMLWLRATKQAARQVINGIPMDEDERRIIVDAEIVPEERPRLKALSDETVARSKAVIAASFAEGTDAPTQRPDPTAARRPGRPRKEDAGIAGAAAISSEPAAEVQHQMPQSSKEQPTAPAEESGPASESSEEPEVPKKTSIQKGEQIKGALKINSIVEELVPQFDGIKKKRFKMEVEGAYWGIAYSYCVTELEGKTGETVNIIAVGKPYAGAMFPYITDVLKQDGE